MPYFGDHDIHPSFSGEHRTNPNGNHLHPIGEDCTFLYFKPSGKWKYDGRGRFPRPPIPGKYYSIDREAIVRENGSMPGIVYNAEDLIIVIIPDEGCDVKTAFPRMLHPTE